jgi:hypothetical protein
MLKITLAELKKSLYAIKNNNILKCIAGEQLVNIDSNTTFPLVNVYDILNGTLNMLTILKNRGFIDVKKVYDAGYEQTELITINPILHDELRIPLIINKDKDKGNTVYNKGEIVFIYPIDNKRSKYLRGIVDKYKFNRLFIHVFDITGTAWAVKNIYNIHKDYSYQYIIKIPMILNNKSFNSLSILKIDLSYFFKTIYTFIENNNDNSFIIDVNNLQYDKHVWNENNLTINNYEYILKQINIFKVSIDNIYNIVSNFADTV